MFKSFVIKMKFLWMKFTEFLHFEVNILVEAFAESCREDILLI